VDRETARELEEPTLFAQAGGVGGRRVQWVTPTARVE
jgi:hypothetical protein